MQFFFLLLFNVFLGAVLYLVISLKLERSATEFRERRFRKEMEEMIKEFNVTAERNISILEGRIRMLRRLLEKSGDLKSMDIVCADEEAHSDSRATQLELSMQKAGDHNTAEETTMQLSVAGIDHSEHKAGTLIKKGLLIFFDKIIHILPSLNGRMRGIDKGYQDISCESLGSDLASSDSVGGRNHRTNIIIEKDMSMIAAEPDAAIMERSLPLTEDEIYHIVSSSEDKYSMVSVLYERGCAIEDISRYSGIPAGEVRLVLNLNNSRP